MHDQYGNYVIQCCLQFGQGRNSFIFDGLAHECLAIASSRFGSRAMRSCLESPFLAGDNQRLQKLVATPLIKLAPVLMADANGVIVMQWLVDSELPGRYGLLGEALKGRLGEVVTCRPANNVISRLMTQTAEPEARLALINDLIKAPEDPHGSLQTLLKEPSCLPIALRILSGCPSVQRLTILDAFKRAIPALLSQHTHLQRLVEEMALPRPSVSPTRHSPPKTPSPAQMVTLPGRLGDQQQHAKIVFGTMPRADTTYADSNPPTLS